MNGLRDRPSGRVGMPHRDDARPDARKLLPRVGRRERRHEPEPVPVLDPVEERLAVVRRGALVLIVDLEGAGAAQVLRGLGVGPRDCSFSGGGVSFLYTSLAGEALTRQEGAGGGGLTVSPLQPVILADGVPTKADAAADGAGGGVRGVVRSSG